MNTQLSFSAGMALFGAMFVLAAIPSVSVLAVSARSAASGFTHGALTTLGIVVGDIVFILIAIFGLSLLADRMGQFFVLVKYLGGAYLVWLGLTLWRSKAADAVVEGTVQASLSSSVLSGLFITLGDQKAVLFYFGFFPAFIDLSAVTVLDAAIVMIIASVAIGVVKLAYALVADRSGVLLAGGGSRRIKMAAGVMMMAVGVVLILRA